MTVYCRKCGKAHEIKPDNRGFITENLIYWIKELDELCNECRAKKKEAKCKS